jgi:transcriptional regulator with XRE-family HTH domain
MSDIIRDLDSMFKEAIEGADHETLGEKLQKKRATLNLKLVDIARITGLSESLVGKIESDKIDDIKISTMKKLSIAYNISPKIFITHMGLDDSLNQMNRRMNEISDARILFKKIPNKT